MRNRPADSELEILRILWDKGPSTVRDVHDELSKRRQIVYTTVLKAMQIMHEKKLLHRDESQRSHVYSPAVDEHAVKKTVLDGVIDLLFGGSGGEVAMRALSSKAASDDEIAKVREIIDDMEKKKARKKR